MKYLITGAHGQLGHELVRELEKRGEKNYLALGKEQMDITEREQVFKVVLDYCPDVIIHCAAWTLVDQAEEMIDKVNLINVEGTKNLVDVSIELGIKIIYISTDYVFDGTKDTPYLESDQPNPKSVYGRTKYEGELEVLRNPKHFIARVSWVFGINGHNFIETMLKLAKTRDEVNVVCDQVGSPTYTVDLARVLIDMSCTSKYGVYHINNDGYCSWADLARYIFESNHLTVLVNSVSTDDYIKLMGIKQAYRPRNSRLSKEKLKSEGFSMLPSWQDAVDRYCKELNDQLGGEK